MALEANWVEGRKWSRSYESPYRRWQQAEGIPVHSGSFLEDLHTVTVGPWPRIGQQGAFVNLADQQQDDGWVIEIAPGGETSPIRHAFEANIYVVEGRGATTIWQPNAEKQTVEWQAGSIFSPPINACYQHFNLDGQARARLFSVTNAPMLINIYRNPDFLFNNSFVFDDRYAGEGDFFSDPGRKVEQRQWKTNFIPDVRAFTLELAERGQGATGMQFLLSNNQAMAHCSEFPAGTYKRAHRHGVGAHVIVVTGIGYSLLWYEGENERRRVDWKEGTVISPKEGEYHQHFNIGSAAARYIAFRLGELDTHRPPPGQGWNTQSEIVGLSYEDQDPAIYDTYLAECARHGATVTLERPSYRR